jgi:hypothetical protein
MTPLDDAAELWQRVQRRAAMLTPELAARSSSRTPRSASGLSEDELTRLIRPASPSSSSRARSPMRCAARVSTAPRAAPAGIVQGVRYYGRDIPVPPAVRTITIGFDILNPRVIDAIRTLETRVITNSRRRPPRRWRRTSRTDSATA